LLHPEGADVADAAGEPGHGLEGGDGGEEAGQVLVLGEIDAALHAFEPVAGEGGADIGIGLGDALRVAGGGFCCDQVRSYILLMIFLKTS